MKLELLKEYIKNTINQEIRSLVRDEIKNYMTETFSGKNNNYSNNIIKENKAEITTQEKPKKFVKYTKNEALNKILNETSGGVPQEGNFVGLMGSGLENIKEQINETKVPENSPESVKTVVNAINRDYRSLLKAVDKKKSSKTS